MFTGLVQSMGTIASKRMQGRDGRFLLRPLKPFEKLVLGESIAVNGVCLTVEEFSLDTFLVYASGETLSRTNLGELRQGGQVNLERALAMGDRLGGHIVSGHVDCVALVDSVSPAGDSFIYRLSFPERYAPQVIDKGSVTLDGISLTVNHTGSSGSGKAFLEVNIIPATRGETTISGWQQGRRVNMETDIIGKYVERMLAPWQHGQDAAGGPKDSEREGRSGESSRLTAAFLLENGF